MASRTMHMAIAKNMEAHNLIRDISRFEIGLLLPDAIERSSESHAVSHFKKTVFDGEKKMIDFALFYKQFRDKIMTDELYLGYYLHLVQDGYYRKFIFKDSGIKVTSPAGTHALVSDYRILNGYLISKYKLEYNLTVPEGFDREIINSVYPFSPAAYLEDMKNDFLPYEGGEPAILTEALADDYIAGCSALCLKEAESLKSGQTGLEPMDYAWERRK